MELIIKNFQCIESQTFRFDSTFNSIGGISSTGKTAVFRALYVLAMNPRGSDSFIQDGKDSASIILKQKEGTVEWYKSRKGGKVVGYYLIDGVKKSATGKDNLETLAPHLNPFYISPVNNSIINLNIDDDKLFPRDASPGDLYKILEDLFQIQNTKNVMKEIIRDRQAKDKELISLDTKIEDTDSCKKKVDAFLSENYVKFCSKVKDYKTFLSLKEQKEIIERDNRRVQELKKLLGKIKSTGLETFTGSEVDLNILREVKVSRYKKYLTLTKQIKGSKVPELSNLLEVAENFVSKKNALTKLKSGLEATKLSLEATKLSLEAYKTCPACGGAINEN